MKVIKALEYMEMPINEKSGENTILAKDEFGNIFIPMGLMRINDDVYDAKDFHFDLKSFLRGEPVKMLDGETYYIKPPKIKYILVIPHEIWESR